MTTIAVDQRDPSKIKVCADNCNTEFWQEPCKKLYRIASGPNKDAILGAIGACAPALLVIDLITNGWIPNAKGYSDDERLSLDVDEDFEVLIVQMGRCYTMGRLFQPVEITRPTFALGSGSGYAMGAMDAGKDVREAVRISCGLDQYTDSMGRKLQYMEAIT
jgi:hypothetical protein